MQYSYSDNEAMSEYEHGGDRILRALAKAWRHAQHIPQNMQQHRAAILLPAIEARLVELSSKETVTELANQRNAVSNLNAVLAAARGAGYGFEKGADGLTRMIPMIHGQAQKVMAGSAGPGSTEAALEGEMPDAVTHYGTAEDITAAPSAHGGNTHGQGAQLAALDWPMINAIIASHFADDAVNACRAHAVVTEVLTHIGAQPAAHDEVQATNSAQQVAETSRMSGAEPNVDANTLLDAAQLMREAAAIIESVPAEHEPQNMRYPIVDELHGFAAMFTDEHSAPRPKIKG